MRSLDFSVWLRDGGDAGSYEFAEAPRGASRPLITVAQPLTGKAYVRGGFPPLQAAQIVSHETG